MTERFVDHEVELDVALATKAARVWVERNTSAPSQSVFEGLIRSEINPDDGSILEDIPVSLLEQAIGAAILNELFVEAIKAQLEREDDKFHPQGESVSSD